MRVHSTRKRITVGKVGKPKPKAPRTRVKEAVKEKEPLPAAAPKASRMQAVDALLNLGAVKFDGTMSPSFENVLFGGEVPRILIVKAVTKSVKDPDGFVAQMGRFGYKVVFLYFDSDDRHTMPIIERVQP